MLSCEDVFTRDRLLPIIPASEGLIEGWRMKTAPRAEGPISDRIRQPCVAARTAWSPQSSWQSVMNTRVTFF